MSKQISIATSVCHEYQRLLEESQSALEYLNAHQAQICHSHLVAKEAGDELLRLQANFARAYTVLQNHARNCFRCHLLSRVEARNTENSLDALSSNELYT
jgi:hypothetical protein